jgi:hypothetical protein
LHVVASQSCSAVTEISVRRLELSHGVTAELDYRNVDDLKTLGQKPITNGLTAYADKHLGVEVVDLLRACVDPAPK